jgi:hypothetical protein
VKRVTRRSFRPKGQKIKRGERDLHNEELYNRQASTNIIWTITSKRMMHARYEKCI